MNTSADQVQAMKGLYSPRTVRDVLAGMPELQRFRERLMDPAWPSAQEVAEAERGLMRPPSPRQKPLPLEHGR